MNNHIVHSYDKQLTDLVHSIVSMGELVREMLGILVESLDTPSEALLEKARSLDKKVNAFDSDIERQATALLALRQPMAIDLRLAISGFRLAVIMERMGDLTKNAIKRTLKSQFLLEETLKIQVKAMVVMVMEMQAEALSAFALQDTTKAAPIITQDEEVDIRYRQVMEALQSAMVADPSNIPSWLQYVFMVRNIERIGDYVTKTAKIVHYIVTGERAPKHMKVADKKSH